MKKVINRKIIALDMDGTLLNKKKRISLKTLFYLRKLTKQGHIVILASGRPSRVLKGFYNKLHLKSPMICYNGSYVYNPYDEKFPKIQFEFDHQMIKEIVNVSNNQLTNIMCETDKDIWIDKEDKFLSQFFWYKNTNIHLGEINDTLDQKTMTFIAHFEENSFNDSEIMKVVERYPEIGVRYWGVTPYFELFYKQSTKGNALKIICNYYGISTKDLICFGDAANDFEMFEIAGTSVAMKNAMDDLKKKATMVSDKDNNHNGIYYALKKILN